MAETKQDLEATGIAASPLVIDTPHAPAIDASPAGESGAAVRPLVLSGLDGRWYQRLLGAASESLGSAINVPENLTSHYLDEGVGKGRSSARTFSTIYYRARSAGLLSNDVNPPVDLLRRGNTTAVAPHPLLKQGAPLLPADRARRQQ